MYACVYIDCNIYQRIKSNVIYHNMIVADKTLTFHSLILSLPYIDKTGCAITHLK